MQKNDNFYNPTWHTFLERTIFGQDSLITIFDIGLAIDFKIYIYEFKLGAILLKQGRAKRAKQLFCGSGNENKNRMQLNHKIYGIYKIYSHENHFVNSLRPSDAYMRQ